MNILINTPLSNYNYNNQKKKKKKKQINYK